MARYEGHEKRNDHEYFGINENIVWDTIRDDLLPIIPLLKEVLEWEGCP